MGDEKPEFRKHDENPHRSDDINLHLPWLGGFRYEGSGRTLIALIVGVGLLTLGAGSSLYTWWHDDKAEKQHMALREAIDQQARAVRVQICVLTLNEEEKRAYRLERRYC